MAGCASERLILLGGAALLTLGLASPAPAQPDLVATCTGFTPSAWIINRGGGRPPSARPDPSAWRIGRIINPRPAS